MLRSAAGPLLPLVLVPGLLLRRPDLVQLLQPGELLLHVLLAAAVVELALRVVVVQLLLELALPEVTRERTRVRK